MDPSVTTPGKTRRKSSHSRKAEVLEVASRVFFEKGYQATSVQDIADELGILKGSVYYYISGKEDLLFEILDNYHQQASLVFNEASTSDAPVLERLRSFIATETEHAANHYRQSALFYSEWRSLSPERRQPIMEERNRHSRFVEDCIREAQELGLIDPDLDQRLASNGILGMVNSVYSWYHPDGPRTTAEIGAAFAALAIDGLARR